jgi:hypothetical protein
MRRALALAVALLFATSAASAATTPTRPVYDAKGHIIQTPFAPVPVKPRLTKAQATAALLAEPKVREWVSRYPKRDRQTDAEFSKSFRQWTVHVWAGKPGEIARGVVDDDTGLVREAWTGPQVAWKMARGIDGAFGGKDINSAPVWLGFCLVFLLGLADFRRPLSLRNLDLLVLVSFTVSLWFFNRGDVFTSMPLAYPPLLYLLGRMLFGVVRGPARGSAPVWPVWVLAAATVFLAGFRVGLNVESSNVIDVGFSGVVGAHRIAHGEAPYGHFPQDKGKACGPTYAGGEIPLRIQSNGRCENANPQGDTYGPVAYEAYLPGYALFGWTGKWDKLWAAHFTAIAADLLCLLGLALVGRRFGGNALAVTLAFAWAAWPFTQYVSNSNTNDALMPLFLIWGFWLVTWPAARGAFAALAGWTKFGALLVAPLWASYPDALGRRREKAFFVGAFVAATLAVFSILLLEPHPLSAVGTFWDRTVGWQLDRRSPFSIWDWRQYGDGLPDFHLVQRVLEGLVLLGAIAAYFLPRRKSPLQLAALTAALLIGFELVLTHWFYLYLPWFFPFVAYVSLAPAAAPEPAAEELTSDREPRELVATA